MFSSLSLNPTYGLNTMTSEEDNFTVLYSNHTGKWKIVEGIHPLRDLKCVSESLFQEVNDSRNRVITIFFTNVCNLRCTYCRFEELTHYAKEYKDLNVEGIVRSITSVIRPGELVEIHIQGGEPCLRIDLVDNLCSTLNALESTTQFRFHLTTNGTIISEQVIEVIRKHSISITLSIDGLREMHDKHRFFANGKGSFDQVLKAVKTFGNEQIRFGVFCVVTDASRMLEIYDYYTNSLKIKSFLLAPLELEGNEDIDELQRYLRSFYNHQMEILDRNINIYKATGKRISENLTEILLRGKVFPGYSSKACGDTPTSKCGTNIHSIERNGDITECQNTRHIQDQGKDYINSCLDRNGICSTCEIRGICSTPICFSRLDVGFVQRFSDSGEHETKYINMVCSELKRREKMLFQLFYHRKEDVLDYMLKR